MDRSEASSEKGKCSSGGTSNSRDLDNSGRMRPIVSSECMMALAMDEFNKYGSSVILNEYKLGARYTATASHECDIKMSELDYLTNLSLLTCTCFPLTGLPSIYVIHKMKKHFFRCEYAKAIKYKKIAQILTSLNIVLALLTLIVIIFVINLRLNIF